MERIKTGISKAFWCARQNNEFVFQAASMPNIAKGKQVSWFDELFDGGIAIPLSQGNEQRALTILISGPPGSGKSTLALEFAYHLRRENYQKDDKSDRWHTLYVTSESSEDWLLEKWKSYGWNTEAVHTDKEIRHPEIAHVDIIQATDLKWCLECEEIGDRKKTLIGVLRSLYPAAGEAASVALKEEARRKICSTVRRVDPDVLIVDSLNTVQYEDRAEIFNKFSELATTGPKIVVIILDSQDGCRDCEFWEYVCDTIIRLGKRHDPTSNYMVRTLEIVKARYQSHAWGVHQLKIYGPQELKQLKGVEARRRAHPYREEGGLFIFPSIHYHLSNYKRKSPQGVPEPGETYSEELNRVLHGGFPRGRCSGFMGERGNHKSHLGYLHVLHRIKRHKEKGLIISLRDDEGMARKTLQSILGEEFGQKEPPGPGREKLGRKELTTLEWEDRLEILYYPPGYITPEEFFHRMYLSIQRLRHDDPEVNITLLFNSLDQLGSRFPLCAQERVFIPGIVETLSAENITSIFIGVDEPGQPPEQYGLLSMADLILSFEKRRFPLLDYMGHLQIAMPKDETARDKKKRSLIAELGSNPEAVVVRVERFSGGQTAGKGGILELVKAGSYLRKLYKKEGLCFTEFLPQYFQGFVEEIRRKPYEQPE
jgi:KaiC/GvpD/RAD55 family RecA-like ATPase